MADPYWIRRFAPEDGARLQRIRAAAFQPIFAGFRAQTGPDIALHAFGHADQEQAEYLAMLCREDEGHAVYCAGEGPEIFGFCAIKLDHRSRVGEILLTAVDPAQQNRAIAQRMFGDVLARMREAGMAVATVGTGSDEAHAPARRAYEQAGFGPVIQHRYYYQKL